MVILIWRHGRFCSRHDCVSFLLIADLWRSEDRQIHVSGHVRHPPIRLASHTLLCGWRQCWSRSSGQTDRQTNQRNCVCSETRTETQSNLGHHDVPRGSLSSNLAALSTVWALASIARRATTSIVKTDDSRSSCDSYRRIPCRPPAADSPGAQARFCSASCGGTDSVSYTHLDVYKRQSPNSAENWTARKNFMRWHRNRVAMRPSTAAMRSSWKANP